MARGDGKYGLTLLSILLLGASAKRARAEGAVSDAASFKEPQGPLELAPLSSGAKVKPRRFSLSVGEEVLLPDSSRLLESGDARESLFELRDSDGSKRALSLESGERGYRTATPGYLSVHRCMQPRSLQHREDAWQLAHHCEVSHIAVRNAAGQRVLKDALLTTKIGLPVELRPYHSTARLEVGQALPLRVYLRGRPQAGVEVVAYSPSGSTQRGITNAKGALEFEIDALGQWEIRSEVPDSEMPSGYASASLRFELHPPADAVEPVMKRPDLRAAATSDWREIGPRPISGGDTGRVTDIAVHPSKEDLFYISTASGGAWRYDSGKWTPLTDDLSMLATGAIAIDPKNPDTLYLGGGEPNFAPHCYYGAGIFKSKDGGKSWKNIGKKVSAGRAVSSIVIAKDDSEKLYVAVQRAGGSESDDAARHHPDKNGQVGVYRSDDGGKSWSLLDGLPKGVGATDVQISPEDDKVLYAGLGDRKNGSKHGAYRSKDGGKSWSKLSLPGVGSKIGRVTIAVSKSSPSTVYVLVAAGTPPKDPRQSKVLGLWRSDDGGDSFKKHNPGRISAGFGWFMLAAGVNPKNADEVVVGAINLVRSSSGGGGFADISPPHPDIHAITWDAAGRLLIGDDGGVHRSTNSGRSWKSLNDGLGSVQFYPALALHPKNPDWILGGLQDNGTVLWNGSSWRRVFGGDGGYAALHPENPSVVLGQSQHTGNLMRSSDGGRSFRKSSSGIDKDDRDAFFNPVIFEPQNKDVAYYGTQRLYRSENQGRNWRAVSKDLTDGAFFSAIRSIDVSPSEAGIIYVVTTDGRLSVSEDGGKSFDVRLQDITDWKRVSRDLVISDRTPDVAYLGVPRWGSAIGQVVKTSDRGKTWTDISGNLPKEPVASIDHWADPDGDGDSDILFVGTDREIFVSCNDGEHWTAIGKGRANAMATEIRYQPQFERLVVGTMGRGIWLREKLSPDAIYKICEAGESEDPKGSGSGSSNDSEGPGGGSGDSSGSGDSGNSPEPGESPDPDESKDSGDSPASTPQGSDSDGSPGDSGSPDADSEGGGASGGGGCSSVADPVGALYLFGLLGLLGRRRRP